LSLEVRDHHSTRHRSCADLEHGVAAHRLARELRCWFGAINATTRRSPLERSAAGVVHTPIGLMFESVVGLAQVGQVVVSSRSVVLPINGVVKVGVGS